MGPRRPLSTGKHGIRNIVHIVLKHRFDSLMQLALAISLAIAFVLSPVSNQKSHSLFAVAEVAAHHIEEAAHHGHPHDNAAETIGHAFSGHVHNAADHDHNVLFLMPDARRDIRMPRNLHEPNGSEQAYLGLVLGFDRPPRA